VILFIAADPRECTSLLTRWQDVHPLLLPVNWARAGRWRGAEAVAIANGAGAERAFAAVLLAPRPAAICNIGFCGALDATLRIGDVVVATEIRNGTRTYPATEPAGATARSVTLVSIDHVARTAAEKSNLRATGASIVEMEAAGAARAAEDLDLPFYCIRAVSDLATEDFANDFNAALGPDGQFSVLRLVTGALASPKQRFTELMRLKQRTALASKNLGDFLANCTF
jgi:adenosylhomocysteine nucleosidase